MKGLSVLAEAVQASTTLAIDAMYKKMQAEGINVIGFGAGEPDFDTPNNIKEMGMRAIEENKTRYTPTPGVIELREAICNRMKDDCGIESTPEQVVVSNGGKLVLYASLKALINPGDEVILPAPYWVSYYELIKMVGGIPVVVQTKQEAEFKITSEQLKEVITENTKALILNNPSNPTGMVYGKEDLQLIADICVEEDLYVIADEMYYGLLYDNKPFTSFVSLGEKVQERTILINGVSKSYAMTGWRIGYAIAPAVIAKVMSNYLSHAASAPASISQWAAVEALNGPQDGIEVMRQAFEERRNYLYERMNAIEKVSCIKPEGAFYIMMNLDEIIGTTLHGIKINSSDDFAKVFLEKGLVAVVPCTGFGAPNFVRWSYATSMENIKEGLDRLEKFLA